MHNPFDEVGYWVRLQQLMWFGMYSTSVDDLGYTINLW